MAQGEHGSEMQGSLAVLDVRGLAERVHDVVLDRIVAGRIAPGEAIRQDVLAAELGISKIPLREALSRLEESHLVERVPNQGFMVARLSVEEIDDLFALRLLIEPKACADGAARADAADRARTRRVYDHVEESGAQGDFFSDTALRRRLLLSMVAPLQRPVTERLIGQLYNLSERYAAPTHATDLPGQAAGLRAVVLAWLDGRIDDAAELHRSRLELRWAAARRNAQATSTSDGAKLSALRSRRRRVGGAAGLSLAAARTELD